MSDGIFNFPDQTIPDRKKTKEWHRLHGVEYIRSRSSTYYEDRQKAIEQLYRAYLCVMNKEEEKLFKIPVTNPEGINLGIEYQIYNLIEQKVEQMVGDYLDRPLRKKAYVLNKEAQVRKLDKKVEMMSEHIIREMNKSFSQQYGVELDSPNPEMELPENIEDFFAKNYRDHAEEVADDLVEKFLLVDKNREHIPEILKDWLIADECHTKIVFEDGTLKWRKGHPLDVDTDKDPNKIVQDDHEYYVETHFLTENEILNTFELTADEIKSVQDDFLLIERYKNGKLSSSFHDPIIDDKGWYLEDNSEFRIAVLEMSWKSRRKIRAKTIKDSNGVDRTVIMNDKDRYRKEDVRSELDLEVPRHVLLAGPNIVLSWGLEEHRHYKISSKKKCYLEAISMYRQNQIGVSAIRSVASKLFKMQSWASEILFELRLAMRQNNGKVMIYDVAQTPRQYLKNANKKISPLNQVKHHMKRDKIVYINSKEKNNRYQFNQFTAIDLSNSKAIQDLMEGLMLIEDISDRMIGLTPGRQGQAGQHTTATNVESQRKASFSKTEIYYRPFDNFIQSCLERMLMKAKKVYKENDFIQYVLGDLQQKFIQIMPEFMDSDIGLYFNDAGKDAQKKQIIDQAAQLTLGNAQTPEMMKALIDILCEDTAVESRAILDRTVNRLAQMQEERAQAEQQAIAAQQQSEQEDKDIGHQLTARGQDANIEIAHIYADQKQDQVDTQEATKKMIKLADIENQNIQQIESNN